MWIDNLIRALTMLNDLRYLCYVDRIENDVIYMMNGTKYLVQDLVAEYEKEYGGS